MRKTFVVINRAGKVGKSTISKHLLAPVAKAEWVQIETHNDTGEGADFQSVGRKFYSVSELVFTEARNTVIDVGASNYAEVLKQLEGLGTFVNNVTAWVIPTTTSDGMIADTFGTAQDLVERLEVDPSKIMIVLNKVADEIDAEDKVISLTKTAKKLGLNIIDRVIVDSHFYDRYNKDERNIFEIADDATDYLVLSAKAQEDGDVKERDRLLRAQTLRDMAVKARRNMRAVAKAFPIDFSVTGKS